MFEMGAKLGGEGWNVDSVCPKCGENRSECACEARKILPINQHRLVFRREKRKGKPVTIVGEFFREESELKSLVSTIKKKLASGGTHKQGWLEFQGEVREAVQAELVRLGYPMKKQ